MISVSPRIPIKHIIEVETRFLCKSSIKVGLVPTSVHSPSPSYVAMTVEFQATVDRAAFSLNSVQTFDMVSGCISWGSDPSLQCPYGCNATGFIMTHIEKEVLEFLNMKIKDLTKSQKY